MLGDAMTEERQQRPPKVRTLVAFSSLIMLLFCVFVAYQASKAYDSAIIEGKMNAERLTTILSDHLELSFLAVDLTLRRAVERNYFNTLFGGNLPKDIENNFRLWVNETPQVAAIMLVNSEGDVDIAASKIGYSNWFDYNQSLAEKEVFTSLRDSIDNNFYIGSLKTTNPEHPELILMSRRLNKLDGTFGGVIIAAIDPEFFSAFFESVGAGPDRFMSLFLDSGELLFSSKDDQSADTVMQYVISYAAANRTRMDVVTETETIQKNIKIFSYSKLNYLPIYVSIVIDEEDFLAEWRDARLKDISFLAIFTIFGSVLSFFALTMAKQIVRVEESEAAAILASQAKSEFLANMSHELRTPLNAIIGFSEMMNAGYFGPLNDKQKERIHDINLCGSHLLQLISDILEFSKGEAGRLELNEEHMDVAEIINECVRIINEKAKSKHINIIVDASESLPAVWADKRKLRQILLNLLSNAAKFTPEHGDIRVSAKLDHHGQMNLIVSDTGIGIPEEDIQTALSVFGQVHRSQSHEGTGLGLPLCKMFAELHGGKLTLVSAVGEGTTVRVTLPPTRVQS